MSVPNNTKCLLWKPLSHNNYYCHNTTEPVDTFRYTKDTYTKIHFNANMEKRPFLSKLCLVLNKACDLISSSSKESLWDLPYCCSVPTANFDVLSLLLLLQKEESNTKSPTRKGAYWILLWATMCTGCQKQATISHLRRKYDLGRLTNAESMLRSIFHDILDLITYHEF